MENITKRELLIAIWLQANEKTPDDMKLCEKLKKDNKLPSRDYLLQAKEQEKDLITILDDDYPQKYRINGSIHPFCVRVEKHELKQVKCHTPNGWIMEDYEGLIRCKPECTIIEKYAKIFTSEKEAYLYANRYFGLKLAELKMVGA